MNEAVAALGISKGTAQRAFWELQVNGQHCGQRLGKLFSDGRYSLRRHCYSVAYGV